MGTDLVGWASAALLLATLVRQVYVQWRSKSVAGVSKWLFRGQIAASIGFVVYSVRVENWVFVVTNALIGVTAIVGQARFSYVQRKGRPGSGAGPAQAKEGVKPGNRRAGRPRTAKAAPGLRRS